MIGLILTCCVTLANDWYDGPLFERMIVIEQPSSAHWHFRPRGPHGAEIAALSRRLEVAPIYVLAPDDAFAGYGLESDHKGGIWLVGFDWLIADAKRRRGPRAEDHVPDGGPGRHASLPWALAALREMGIEPDTEWEPGFGEFSKTWAGLHAHDREVEIGHGPTIARFALEELGAELPVELVLAPVPPPPPPYEPPPPRTNAEMRAIFRASWLPIPPEFLVDEGGTSWFVLVPRMVGTAP